MKSFVPQLLFEYLKKSIRIGKWFTYKDFFVPEWINVFEQIYLAERMIQWFTHKDSHLFHFRMNRYFKINQLSEQFKWLNH